MIFSRILPILSFTIGTSALLFQITVLYPWHVELDRDFQILKKAQEEQLDFYHKKRLEKLDEINGRIDNLLGGVRELKELKKKSDLVWWFKKCIFLGDILSFGSYCIWVRKMKNENRKYYDNFGSF